MKRSWLTYLGILGIAGCAAFVGCSGGDDDDGSGNGGDGTGGSAASVNILDGGNTGGQNTGGTGLVTNQDGNCIVQTEEACVGELYAGEDIPLDIYIMFDTSASMCQDLGTGFFCDIPTCSTCCNGLDTHATEGSRMAAVRTAAQAFLNDPESAGISVGLGVFGHQCIGSTSCNFADYVEPRVEIGELPGNAPALVGALNALEPTGETPTHAAIGGACAHAIAWKEEHPGHEVVILLMTDGKPEAPVTTTCEPTAAAAIEAAAGCLDEAGIKTYVLGIGQNLETLEGIAVAGGTTAPYIVDTGDPAQQILDALNSIRGAAIPCDFTIPEPSGTQMLNYDLVNMVHVNSACEANAFSYVETQTGCGDTTGWYFDTPPGGATPPSSIHLCPKSCDNVKSPESQFYFSVSCEIVVVPR